MLCQGSAASMEEKTTLETKTKAGMCSAEKQTRATNATRASVSLSILALVLVVALAVRVELGQQGDAQYFRLLENSIHKLTEDHADKGNRFVLSNCLGITPKCVCAIRLSKLNVCTKLFLLDIPLSQKDGVDISRLVRSEFSRSLYDILHDVVLSIRFSTRQLIACMSEERYPAADAVQQLRPAWADSFYYLRIKVNVQLNSELLALNPWT